MLWKMPRGTLAQGEPDARLNQDAQLGARLIRSYSKDWLDGDRTICRVVPPLRDRR